MEKIDWKYGEAFSDGEIVRFAVGTKTYGGLWATVDLSDWPVIRDHRWRATRRKHLFYVRGTGGRQTLLHRFLIGTDCKLVIDHIDGDGLNNRRSNIRECTQSENVQFGADRRRGYIKRIERTTVPTKPHVVRVKLADGTMKEYIYPSRAKNRTKPAVIVKDSI